MTEFERKLAALTPSGVDHDALLFAAGRASAPSPRWWKRACGLLVVTQLVTLGLWLGEWWGSATPPVPPLLPVVPAEQLPVSPPDPTSYLVLLRTWDDARPPTGEVGGVEPRRSQPLSAGSRDFH